MNVFTAIEEGQAIIVSKGVYRQVAIYEREGRIYAKSGSGFVRLMAHGRSSSPNIRWHEIDAGFGNFTEATGGYVTYVPPSTQEAAE